MKRFLSNLALIILATIVVLFIVANRGTVTVSLWPLPFEVDLGLYLVFFIGLFAGIGLTLVVVSVKRARSFARARRAEKETRRLQTEVDSLEQELDAGATPADPEAELPRLPPDVP